jgi:hypothetical protein
MRLARGFGRAIITLNPTRISSWMIGIAVAVGSGISSFAPIRAY